MKLKEKLFGLAILVGLLLAMVVAFLLWHSFRVQESVHRFVPATEYLCNIAETRSDITRQMKEVMDFLAQNEERDWDEYLQSGTRAERAMLRWRKAIEEQIALDVPGEDEDLERFEIIERKYRRWQQEMKDVYQLHQDKQHQRAQEKFAQDVNKLLLDSIFVELDEALEDGQEEVQDAYHELLLSLSILPWVAKEGTLKLNQTQATIDYLVAVSRLSTKLNRQATALMNFLLSGEDGVLSLLTLNQAEIQLTLVELSKAHEKRLHFGSNIKDLDFVISIDRHYQQAMILSEQLINLKQQSDSLAILAPKAQLLENIYQTELFPGLTKALEDGSAEIINLTSSTQRQGILLVVVISFAVMVISMRWIRTMVTSLHQIKNGMEIIGQGNLSHRINLNAADELGELADSFDHMVAKVQKSRNEIEQMNTSLEQRVHERTTQLETINHELEAFSYSVSHDLRGPLTKVNGLIQLLMYDDDDMSKEQIQKYQQEICAATLKMSQTIDDLLQLSRISSELISADYINLSEMVSQIARELQVSDSSRRVHWIIAPNLAAFGDRNLLRLALDNLLGNAWKYTSQKAEAEIEFGQVNIEGSTLFFIRDNGAGFDMRDVGRIFLPFQRLHQNTEFSGSGIGLATVQRIIHRHGGTIRAEGGLNAGATFYFSLNKLPRGKMSSIAN